jgi:RNA polymerase-interacting CarD/CdnL/TRCF family regulator
VEEILGQKSVDEILDTLNRSDLEKRRDQEDRYRQLHSWYYREHA